MNNLESNIKNGYALGASVGLATFIALAEAPEDRHRVRYGHLNGDSDVIACESYGDALRAYKSLDWLSERDGIGRRFVEIEVSHDGGKTWTGRLFHDCQ